MSTISNNLITKCAVMNCLQLNANNEVEDESASYDVAVKYKVCDDCFHKFYCLCHSNCHGESIKKEF